MLEHSSNSSNGSPFTEGEALHHLGLLLTLIVQKGIQLTFALNTRQTELFEME
jgi:hypothetical protein